MYALYILYISFAFQTEFLNISRHVHHPNGPGIYCISFFPCSLLYYTRVLQLFKLLFVLLGLSLNSFILFFHVEMESISNSLNTQTNTVSRVTSNTLYNRLLNCIHPSLYNKICFYSAFCAVLVLLQRQACKWPGGVDDPSSWKSCGPEYIRHVRSEMITKKDSEGLLETHHYYFLLLYKVCSYFL